MVIKLGRLCGILNPKKGTYKYIAVKHSQRLRKKYIDIYETILEAYWGIFSVRDACFCTILDMGGPDLLDFVLANLVCCYLCFKLLACPFLLYFLGLLLVGYLPLQLPSVLSG